MYWANTGSSRKLGSWNLVMLIEAEKNPGPNPLISYEGYGSCMVPTSVQETETRYLQRPLNSKMVLGVLVQVCRTPGVLFVAKIA